MKRIAITGGIGTGKSTVAQMLVDAGAALIDADAIVHALYTNDAGLRAQLATTFGANVLDANGQINRPRLATIVFADTARRTQLEALVHPLVRSRMQQRAQQLEQSGVTLIVFDIPLLFESYLPALGHNPFDAILVVACDAAAQIARLQKRYHCDAATASERIDSQLPLAEKIRRADCVITTDGALDDTRTQVQRLLFLPAAKK